MPSLELDPKGPSLLKKAKQVERSKKPIILFSYEKLFTVDSVSNNRTNRYINATKSMLCTLKSWKTMSSHGSPLTLTLMPKLCTSRMELHPIQPERRRSDLEKKPNFWDKVLRPPSSPDLNPLDYSIWTYVESKACASPHNRITALKSSVIK